MRILVTSDWHLGSDGLLPDAEAGLIALLASEPWDKVVLLGDIFDLWRAEFSEIATKYKDLLDALDDLPCDVLYVPGNHDGEFRGVRQLNDISVVWPPLVLCDGGRRIVMMHGDEFDTYSAVNSKIAAWVMSSADWVARKIVGPGASVQRALLRSFAMMPARERFVEEIAWAAVASVSGADTVVLGHTHWPEERVLDGVRYVNCGDWGPEHQTCVVLEDGIPYLNGGV